MVATQTTHQKKIVNRPLKYPSHGLEAALI